MKIDKQAIKDEFDICFSIYPNDSNKRSVVAEDFFCNGVTFAEKECQFIIDKCLENNAENVSLAVCDAESEIDKKISVLIEKYEHDIEMADSFMGNLASPFVKAMETVIKDLRAL